MRRHHFWYNLSLRRCRLRRKLMDAAESAELYVLFVRDKDDTERRIWRLSEK
jgi:hypothetical protein